MILICYEWKALSCGRVVKENPNAYSFILRNHGILVVGSTLEEAFCRLELLCRMANIWIRSKCVLPRSVDISGYTYSLPELSVHDEQYNHYYKELEKCSERLYESVIHVTRVLVVEVYLWRTITFNMSRCQFKNHSLFISRWMPSNDSEFWLFNFIRSYIKQTSSSSSTIVISLFFDQV